MEDLTEYEQDMEIDIDNLHHEWLRQPILYAKYSKLVTKAKKKVSIKHEKVKVVRSELIKKCKKLYDKPTMQDVESFYRRNKKHKRAKEELTQAEYEFDMLQHTISTLQQRRSALENLVRLHLAQYFEGPSEPRSLEAARFVNTEKKRITRNKIKKSMKRRKKKK